MARERDLAMAGEADRNAPRAAGRGRLRAWGRLAVAAGLVVLAALLASACCRRQAPPARPELPALAPVTAAERILILAPHEDDETLAAGGLIQQAVAASAAVRVVFLTYGDHNELAFIAYRKKPWLSPTINRNMGELRRKEALAVAGRLGLAREALVFLGYPDNCVLDIWRGHWGAAGPMRSLLTNARSVPYPDALAFGKPHKGESIATDLAVQLLAFRPTRVLVSHPADQNPDHRAAWLFLQEALLETGGRIPAPDVLVYPIHAGRWPAPRGERPDDWLAVPKRLADAPGAAWCQLELSPEQARAKAEAIRMYRSQAATEAGYLLAFARRNELFVRLGVTPLVAAAGGACPPLAPHRRGLFSEEDPVPEPAGGAPGVEPEPQRLASVSWCDAGEALAVEARLLQPPGEEAGLALSAFGYRRDRPFAEMPKLRLAWSPGWLRGYDQGKSVSTKNVKVTRAGDLVTVSIPWRELGEPEAIFVQVQGAGAALEPSQTGWQLIHRAAGPP